MEIGKHDVSKKALKTLEDVMFDQDDYGFDKYKKALHHSYNYNWLRMALEELADMTKYIQNEMDRKATVIEILEYALQFDNPRNEIELALKLLKTEGTGK